MLRAIGLCGLAVGCGAEMYFPQEPPLPDTGLVRVSETATDTGTPPDTDTDTGTVPTDTGTVPTETLPCTEYGFFYADLVIHNLRAEPLDLYWRDFGCVEYFYLHIEAGQTANQATYDSQAWVVRDAAGEVVDALQIVAPYELWEVR